MLTSANIHVTLTRLTLTVIATSALALGLGETASAAAPQSSCSGLASSSRAGQPGAEAQVQQDIQAQAATDGIAPGALESEFSRNHLGSAEACLA